jgi:hypothetical protein
VEEQQNTQRQRFDRVMGTLHGLPGVRESRPATVMQTIPILNETTTAVVQTYRTEDDGYVIFVQVVDAIGHMRIVLPDKVARAIYRQRDSLVDRSTPESRRRAKARRDREKKRAEKAARSAAWRAKHPDGGPLARARAKAKPKKS